MSERKNRFDSDMPASVAHARELFEQTEKISAQLEQLMPLLALLQMTELKNDDDPIARIVQLLEEISAQQHSLTAVTQQCDQKLMYLVDLLTVER